MNWEQKLNLLIEEAKLPSMKSLTKLAGQASYREYYRVELENHEPLILMKLPEGASSVAEEITDSDFEISDLAFINVHQYLSQINLPIPKIYTYDQDQTLILLEDLGDDSFESVLTPENKIDHYKKAIDCLIKVQNQTSKNHNQNCISFHRKFNHKLLLWEMEHFLEYGIEDYYQIKIPSSEKNEFMDLSSQLVNEILKSPFGFTHRDFQSRNLHYKNDQLYIIDFQDSLIGPLAYDLVALLRDSYVVLSSEEITELLHYYIDQLPHDHPYFNKYDQLKNDFDLITIQRKLKDTGRFQYIFTVKNNPGFLSYRYPSLNYVVNALQESKSYQGLLEIIKKYISDL